VLLATAGVLCEEAATEGEKALQCGSDEFLFGNSCWWTEGGYPYTWAEAEDVCKARHMSLASIHSEEEQTFVFGLTEGSYPWIGLTDATTEGEWQWSDGTPVDYLNWFPGNPDGGDQEDCVYIGGVTGEWFDYTCHAIAGVVCRSPPRCGEGQTFFGGSCWWWDTSDYTWAEAEDECRGKGLTLASIHSQQEQDFVAGLTASWYYWVGLTDAATEGEWQWSDGTPVDYLNWKKGQPTGVDVQNCVFTYGSTGEWSDEPCDDHWGVVCRGQPY